MARVAHTLNVRFSSGFVESASWFNFAASSCMSNAPDGICTLTPAAPSHSAPASTAGPAGAAASACAVAGASRSAVSSSVVCCRCRRDCAGFSVDALPPLVSSNTMSATSSIKGSSSDENDRLYFRSSMCWIVRGTITWNCLYSRSARDRRIVINLTYRATTTSGQQKKSKAWLSDCSVAKWLCGCLVWCQRT